MVRWVETCWDDGGEEYSRIVESKHYCVYPWIVAAVERSKPSSVLDYGGGDGSLLRSLGGNAIATRCYYDPGPAMRRLAAKNLKDVPAQIHGTRSSINSMRFDAIVFCAVWMTLRTEKQCVNALSWMRSHLSNNGKIIFAVTHPCFRSEKFRYFSTNFPMEHYLRLGEAFRVYIRDDNEGVVVHDYHWPLSAMVNQLARADLRIESMAELPDCDERGEQIGGVPPWLVGTLCAR